MLSWTILFDAYLDSPQLNTDRAPKDHTLVPPPVVNVGPQLFHRRAHSADHGSPDPEHLHSGEVSPSNQERSTTVPLGEMTMTPQLTNTLEHIVSQLDILTEVWKIPVQLRFTASLNVYCPECPPGGYNWTPGGQFLPFGHGRDLAALTVLAYGTSLFRIGPR